MSDTNLENVTAERDSLKKQISDHLANSAAQIEAIQNNLQAHQDMLNELLQVSLNLRTNLHSFNKANQKVTSKLQNAEKTIASQEQTIKDLTANNATLQAKIDGLSKPVTGTETVPSDQDIAA